MPTMLLLPDAPAPKTLREAFGLPTVPIDPRAEMHAPVVWHDTILGIGKEMVVNYYRRPRDSSDAEWAETCERFLEKPWRLDLARCYWLPICGGIPLRLYQRDGELFCETEHGLWRMELDEGRKMPLVGVTMKETTCA